MKLFLYFIGFCFSVRCSDHWCHVHMCTLNLFVKNFVKKILKPVLSKWEIKKLQNNRPTTEKYWNCHLELMFTGWYKLVM